MVGDQGIGGGRRREETVGGAEHDHQVGVEPDGPGQRADGDAGTDPTELSRSNLELGGEHRSELATPHGWTDGVEVTKPIEHLHRVVVGEPLRFFERAEHTVAEPPADLMFAPVGPLAPGARRHRMSEIALQRLYECGEFVGRFGVTECPRLGIVEPLDACALPGREPGQTRLPVFVPVDARLASDSLPFGDLHSVAVVAPGRHIREQVEQIAAPKPATVDIEQVEQETRDEPFGRQCSGPAVPGQLGDAEMMLDEARIWSVGGPHDRHAGERRARPCMIEHDSYGVAHLVVGVGGRDDDRVLASPAARVRRCGWGCEPLDETRNFEIDVGHPRVGGEQVDIAERTDRPQQVEFEAERRVREEHDDPFEARQRAYAEPFDRALHEVTLVVPIGRQASGRGDRHPGGLRGRARWTMPAPAEHVGPPGAARGADHAAP